MMGWFNNFRMRMTVLFGGLSLIICTGVVLYVNEIASNRMTAASGEALESIARSVAAVLAETLMEREREVIRLSQTPTFMSSPLDGQRVRQRLEQIKRSYRHYAWVGVADAKGIVRAAPAACSREKASSGCLGSNRGGRACSSAMCMMRCSWPKS